MQFNSALLLATLASLALALPASTIDARATPAICDPPCSIAQEIIQAVGYNEHTCDLDRPYFEFYLSCRVCIAENGGVADTSSFPGLYHCGLA